MQFHYQQLTIATTAPIELIDITARVRDCFAAHPVRQGHLILHCPHTTAYVALNEREAMLQQDMLDYLTGLVPRGQGYRHDRAPLDGRENAHSHLIGLFMNASETIPVQDGELLLGQWQSVFFVELDGPRERRHLNLQIAGV